MRTKKITITKKDITKRVARQVDVKLPLAEKAVTALFTVLREVMAEAQPEVRIEIRGFGVLEVKTTKAKRNARNPKTGEIVYVPQRRKTHFKPGKLLREKLKKPL
jgi:integration host factor subunit beta